MSDFSLLTALLIAWSGITAVLVLLLIYRSVVSMKQEGQLFLDPAESNLEAEQQHILQRLDKIDRYVKSVAVISGALLLAITAIWLYRGIIGFTHPSVEP